MLDKFKQKKAPISLNSVSNAIRNSLSSDLSPHDLNPKLVELVNVNQYGIKPESIVAMAFDPVQSLLAVSTTNHEVRVLGQSTVEVVFEFNSPAPITHLKFVKGVYLVAVLETSSVTVLSLHRKQILNTFLPPGSVTAVEADPSLDWLILGLTNGGIVFYDVDRLNMTSYRIDNLQKLIMPKEKLSPVLNLEWHPRDIGTILVTYSHCAVLYSLPESCIKNRFIYHLTKGSKGFDLSIAVATRGKKKMFGSHKEVTPELIQAHFHPNGLHVVTVHVDNTLAFWDCNTGTLLQARNLFETNLNGPQLQQQQSSPVNLDTVLPILDVKWVCGEDPEVTKLLVTGGDIEKPNVIHVMDFGITLKYTLTSYEKQGDFYAMPSNGQSSIPIKFYQNSSSEMEYLTSITPIASENHAYFNGGHNPVFVIAKSNHKNIYITGAVNELNVDDMGRVLLPPSIAFVHPPVAFSEVVFIKRIDWYSVQSSRISSGVQAKTDMLLRGGAAVNEDTSFKPMGYDDSFRRILVTGHEEGVIRLLDVTRGEVSEPEGLIQISLRETLAAKLPSDLKITNVSCAFEGRDLVAGLANGNLVLCKFSKMSIRNHKNPNDYNDCPVQHSNKNARIISIKDRIRGSFAQSSTFLPLSLMQLDSPDTITCLKSCNIGFTAVAYASGRLIVCDVGRGPAVIFNSDSLAEFVPSSNGPIRATSMEFAIMEYGQEGFSSILLIVGTNGGGNLMYFKILPQPSGGFAVVFADKTIGLNYKTDNDEDSGIKHIIPISIKLQFATPSLDVFSKLSQGILIPGYIIIASDRDVRVLKPPKQKLSHKVIDNTCCSIGVMNVQNRGIILVSLVNTGFVKLSTLPALSDITDIRLPKEIVSKYKGSMNLKYSSKSNIIYTGELVVRTGKSEYVNLALTINDHKLRKADKPKDTTDLLFNTNAIIPPRPTVSAMQWAKGQTGIMSSVDLANLLVGPNRKPSKNPESQLAHNISPEANPNAGYGGYGGNTTTDDDRGYKQPVRKNTAPGRMDFGSRGFLRSLQLGVESVEESFNGYANTMSETMTDSVEAQKKEMYGAAFKNKFGF